MNFWRILRFAMSYGPTVYRMVREILKVIDEHDSPNSELMRMMNRIARENEGNRIVEYLHTLVLQSVTKR